jgi:hypothetical protein
MAQSSSIENGGDNTEKFRVIPFRVKIQVLALLVMSVNELVEGIVFYERGLSPS